MSKFPAEIEAPLAIGALDTDQAAKLTGMGKSTLNKLRTKPGGPRYIKIGRRVLYTADSLREWLAKHERQSTDSAS
jgi:predicted DNA-binding transcriptional regulator AlpA